LVFGKVFRRLKVKTMDLPQCFRKRIISLGEIYY